MERLWRGYRDTAGYDVWVKHRMEHHAMWLVRYVRYVRSPIEDEFLRAARVTTHRAALVDIILNSAPLGSEPLDLRGRCE